MLLQSTVLSIVLLSSVKNFVYTDAANTTSHSPILIGKFFLFIIIIELFKSQEATLLWADTHL